MLGHFLINTYLINTYQIKNIMWRYAALNFEISRNIAENIAETLALEIKVK